MLYYQVLKTSDQVRKPNAKSCDILVSGELYTAKQFSKLQMNENLFEKIEVSKNSTYYFFGARFSSIKRQSAI